MKWKGKRGRAKIDFMKMKMLELRKTHRVGWNRVKEREEGDRVEWMRSERSHQMKSKNKLKYTELSWDGLNNPLCAAWRRDINIYPNIGWNSTKTNIGKTLIDSETNGENVDCELHGGTEMLLDACGGGRVLPENMSESATHTHLSRDWGCQHLC